MSSFLQDLAKQRLLFLEGLDANEGDINLDIFEDFYPDQAHFVFELLQNAEDAGARSATFQLTSDGCSFEHDGVQVFTEADVRAITGIHDSTKAKAPDKIGKFGVGFKSVFVYTLTPTVQSGDFSFKITRLVMPEPIAPEQTSPTITRFWFPFNNPKKPPAVAYAEVEAALNDLAETTLLFLSNLKSIRWSILGGLNGQVLRTQHSQNHFEVLKKIDERVKTSSQFLKFEKIVEGSDRLKVAVAFDLDFLPNNNTYDLDKPIAKQLRIVSATPGRVAVFFPADKETSGLRMHLHAPFVPELSRASIKDAPANQPLFDQLAILAAESLYTIRDLSLLTVDFLGVLPNSLDQIPTRYQGIRAAIVAEMNGEPLTPTYHKSHAPANRLLQARSGLKDLLSASDLSFLVNERGDAPLWAMTATQKNSDADRFLANLAINEWEIDKLIEILREKASVGVRYRSSLPYQVTGPDTEFMDWLAQKPLEWHQRFYALLHSELGATGRSWGFRDIKIVRLSNGEYGIGSECFLATEGSEPDEYLPTVDLAVYTSGRSKTQQESARKFLEEIGVRKIGEAEQIEAILKQGYTREANVPNERTYRRHLKRFVALVESDPTKAKLFSDYYIFECKGDHWCQPRAAFLDAPMAETGLSAYYGVVGQQAKRFALVDHYTDRGVTAKRLARFSEVVGVQTRLEVTAVSCGSNPQWAYLGSVSGDRHTSPVDRDYTILKIDALLKTPSTAISELIWRTMIALPQTPDYLQATYQRSRRWGARFAASQLVHQLRKAAWVPQRNGQFVRPAAASSALLPEGFPFDPGWEWVKAIHFGDEIVKKTDQERQTQALAKQLGFANKQVLEDAQWFAALSAEQRQSFKEVIDKSRAVELPELSPSSSSRHVERVSREAATAAKRRAEDRMRSVSLGLDGVKEEAAAYLRLQYTNGSGEMFCQACKTPLPFKLNDGSDYFEKVELLPTLKRHHHQNYLALCPNHAAMFQYANGSSDKMRDRIKGLQENELAIILAQKHTTIYFTKAHAFDLKTIIEVDESET